MPESPGQDQNFEVIESFDLGDDLAALYEQAARNQGFESLAELIEVSGWCESASSELWQDESDEAASRPMVPKPEFKEQFEAWQKRVRGRVLK